MIIALGPASGPLRAGVRRVRPAEVGSWPTTARCSGRTAGTSFPVAWQDGQKDLFWVHDDLHIPNPVSPMYADIGGWWLKCDYMFRRFGTPFASDWISKIVNGYVYTAAIPARARRSPRRPPSTAPATCRGCPTDEYAAEIGGYLLDAALLRGELPQLVARPAGARDERNFARLDGYDNDAASLVELAILLEDAIDMHDRHWQIHWVLNFAQFSSTTNLNAIIAEVARRGRPRD